MHLEIFMTIMHKHVSIMPRDLKIEKMFYTACKYEMYHSQSTINERLHLHLRVKNKAIASAIQLARKGEP